MQPKKMISRCPVCSGELMVTRLSCGGCGTRVESELAIPPLMRLPEDLRHFVLVFLRSRGSIKEVERELGISYPTVCKRLDLVNELLDNRPAHRDRPVDRAEVLARLERGEINARQAAALLKGDSP